MKRIIGNFWADERAQDLIEYTLLLAFVCLAAAALLVSVGGDIPKICGEANRIAAGETAK